MVDSPKNLIPDIEKDLYLESLSNDNLSRVDGIEANSMQRSFTRLQEKNQPGSVIGMRTNLLGQKPTSELRYDVGAKDLAPDFFDQLADAR